MIASSTSAGASPETKTSCSFIAQLPWTGSLDHVVITKNKNGRITALRPRAAQETAEPERRRILFQAAAACVNHHIRSLALSRPQLILDRRIGRARTEALKLSNPAVNQRIRLPTGQAGVLS